MRRPWGPNPAPIQKEEPRGRFRVPAPDAAFVPQAPLFPEFNLNRENAANNQRPIDDFDVPRPADNRNFEIPKFDMPRPADNRNFDRPNGRAGNGASYNHVRAENPAPVPAAPANNGLAKYKDFNEFFKGEFGKYKDALNHAQSQHIIETVDVSKLNYERINRNRQRNPIFLKI